MWLVCSCNYWSYNAENRELHVYIWLVSATSVQPETMFSEAGEMLQEEGADCYFRALISLMVTLWCL